MQQKDEEWVLKAPELEMAFVTVAADKKRVLTVDESRAKKFKSLDEATKFAEELELSPDDVAEAWFMCPPRLLPVRTGTRFIIVELWAGLFGFLSCISFFSLAKGIRGLFGDTALPYVFVEVWVIGWTLLALMSLAMMTKLAVSFSGVLLFLSILGGVRVGEILFYQINVLFLDEYRNKKKKDSPPYAVRGYRRLVLLTMHNYLEIFIWFAVFYTRTSQCFHVEPDGPLLSSMSGALYHSMVTMTTLGYGNIYPLRGELIACTLAISQTMIGVFLAVVVLARLIALIPKPLSMDEYENS